MTFNNYSTVSMLFVAMTGCGSGEHGNEILTEANQIHVAALATAEKVEFSIDSIRTNTTDPDIRRKTDSIAHLVELWEEGLIEVPGFAHEHEHGSHQHKPAPEMTDESMLEYQKNAHQAIELINEQLKEMLK